MWYRTQYTAMRVMMRPWMAVLTKVFFRTARLRNTARLRESNVDA
jgi:hypothetical protein